ncbi:hypothetical protein NST70_13690 [Weizmannia sp. FSL K6-0777]|uniref:phage neck terminator protein n=1 Tax=Heyndrickxia TaxID=2837504 RepID=UPI002E1F37FF|nr:hypothetical protein [Weizmannia sp. CD-2023]
MNIPDIKAMIARIKQDTGIMIIKGNTTAPAPPLPYGVYNITSPYIKERSRGAQFIDDNGNDTRIEQYRQTISFNLYAEDNETTMELAFKLHQWFLFLGQSYLQDNGLAVYEVGNIEDRTTFLVDSYQYKHGFDVQLRATDEQVKVSDDLDEIIEKVNLGGI